MKRDEIIAVNPIGAWLEGRGVKLVQGGKRAARCPAKEHARTDNVTIDHEKNLWRCHACKSGGTVIDWLAIERGISVADAMRELAGSNGQKSPPERNAKIVKSYDYTDATGKLVFQVV